MKYAVIDIGSNSVRLMLWADGKTLFKRICTTRLGRGIACGALSQDAIGRTADAVAEFVREGRESGAEVLAFATAAVRSASNGADFCGRVKALCGLDVDVVSGKEEALLGLYGALGDSDGGIIDIGGASTEVCLRENGTVVADISLDIGAVRLKDKCGESRDLLSQEIRNAVRPLPGTSLGIYAVGGTATTLASLKLGSKEYDAEKIQNLGMTREEIGEWTEKLFGLSVEERKALDGMDEKRADIIAGGALLLYEIMAKMRLKEVRASDRDNLEGYLRLRGLN